MTRLISGIQKLCLATFAKLSIAAIKRASQVFRRPR